MTTFTCKLLCGFAWIDGLSWLLLVGVDFSSVLLPGSEEEKEEEEEPGPAGLLRLLFNPADNQHKIKNSWLFFIVENTFQPNIHKLRKDEIG